MPAYPGNVRNVTELQWKARVSAQMCGYCGSTHHPTEGHVHHVRPRFANNVLQAGPVGPVGYPAAVAPAYQPPPQGYQPAQYFPPRFQ